MGSWRPAAAPFLPVISAIGVGAGDGSQARPAAAARGPQGACAVCRPAAPCLHPPSAVPGTGGAGRSVRFHDAILISLPW